MKLENYEEYVKHMKEEIILQISFIHNRKIDAFVQLGKLDILLVDEVITLIENENNNFAKYKTMEVVKNGLQ